MILLKRVRLVNWYGFGKEEFPIGKFSMIIGKNGNGKSVLLDAIKYALYGDNGFNRSTDSKGKRTLVSYTRGLIDASRGTYIRPAEEIHTVHTHIVLEFQEEETGNSFLLGTVITTGSANNFTTQRYVLDGQTLDGIAHTYVKEDVVYSYSAQELVRNYHISLNMSQDGLDMFMQRTGLRLGQEDLRIFRRKLQSIMSYNPEAKIDEFIRENVLEKKPVDLKRLVETKKEIDRLNRSFEQISDEMEMLENILASFDAIEKIENALFINQVKWEYRIYNHAVKGLQDAVDKIELTSRQIDLLEGELSDLKRRQEDTNERYQEAERNLRENDSAKAILEAEKAAKQQKEKLENLAKEKRRLEELQQIITDLIRWLEETNLLKEKDDLLVSLLDSSADAAEKEKNVGQFYKELMDCLMKFKVQKQNLEEKVRENRRKQSLVMQIIKDCEQKKIDYRQQIPAEYELKMAIDREFEKRGIASEARFACEYVAGLTDEQWRNVIEGHLKHRRYIILVEPEYYEVALEILHRSQNRKAHLFNTRLLMAKRDIIVESDSVAHFLEVKHPLARKFFQYQLGRFHAVEKEQIKDYETAMTKEGGISVSMDYSLCDFSRTRFYCLGQDAILRTKELKEQELANLRKEEKKLLEQTESIQMRISRLDTATDFLKAYGSYHYNVCAEYEDCEAEYHVVVKHLEELKEAQENNEEYLLLVRQAAELKQRAASLSDVFREKTTENETRKQEKISAEETKKIQNDLKIQYERKLDEKKQKAPLLYEQAVEAYQAYLERHGNDESVAWTERYLADRKSTLKDERDNLLRQQILYCSSRKGAEHYPQDRDRTAYAVYQARKNRIAVDDIQEIRNQLDEQTKRYESIFKNEFVLTILGSCETTKRELKKINNELAGLNFKTRYAFDVKYVSDHSEYHKILEYARYLKEREKLGNFGGQMTLDQMVRISDQEAEKLEKEIQEIISRIVSDTEKGQLERYADYRNYMTYEILMTNEVFKQSRMTQQTGYNSGAEVQIPYLLILLSALMMIYNEKLHSIRLAFIDEPFTKMDPSNVKIMLKFMREQNLQMIFCAPDKIDLIGSECEVLLPVIKEDSTYLMAVGAIEKHKKNSNANDNKI